MASRISYGPRVNHYSKNGKLDLFFGHNILHVQPKT